MSGSPISITVQIDSDELAHLIDHLGAARAREGFRDRFEREVDPLGQLSESERQERVDAALSAHMRRLGKASGKARRAKRTEAVAS